MPTIQYTAQLDFTDNGTFETGWRIKQGDFGDCEIVFRVVNNGVNMYDASVTPEIVFRRADGASVISNMTPNDGTYKYAFVGNELAVPGLTLVDVKYTDSEGRISTASCRFTVVEDTIGYDPTGAHTYDNPVSELVEQATAASEVAIDSSYKAEGFAVGEQGGVPVGPDSPYYHNNAKYYSNLAGDPIGTAIEEQTTTTGQFATKTGGKLESCIVAFEPVQSGSGNPSPDNVRPITGHSSVEVTVSDENETVIEDITVSLGNTYYGGTLDVVSGVLTVDKVSARLLSSFNWVLNEQYAGERRFQYYYGNQGTLVIGKNPNDAICSHLEMVRNNVHSFGTFYMTNTWLVVPDKDSFIASLDAFKSWLSDNEVYVCYELATPQTIQLTPQQINTLIGENHLDVPLTGQSLTSAVYRELFAWNDMEDVVELRLPISAIGTDESNNDTSSQAYSQGDYFYKNGIAKAKTSIASGATFTLGTNYEIKTLAEILKALES